MTSINGVVFMSGMGSPSAELPIEIAMGLYSFNSDDAVSA
jgi:hypothetical protein